MKCWKSLGQYKSDLEIGITDEVPIVTETKWLLRSSGDNQDVDSMIKASFDNLVKICKRMKDKLCALITEPD